MALFHLAAMAAQLPPQPLGPPPAAAGSKSLDKSAYFAFVDREYIFTIEVVKPGVPLLNFISMSEQESTLLAGDVRLTLENRNALAKFFTVDTGDPKEPVILPSVRMRPRSSFGLGIQGEFGNATELLGATIKLGKEDFQLVPLTSFDFEQLASKVNRLNLGSPDFSDDWRVLQLQTVGIRLPARR